MHEYQHLTNVKSLTKGEIAAINQACGNGWRKVFNVYAKLLFALNNNLFHYSGNTISWQTYRDNFLLQQDSATALLFSPPQLQQLECNNNNDELFKQANQLKTPQHSNEVANIASQNINKVSNTSFHLNTVLAANTKVRETTSNNINKSEQPNIAVHIVCGKTYGKALTTNSGNTDSNISINKTVKTKNEAEKHKAVIKLQWLDHDFAINTNNNLIVCPYFDYRQLTNEKIQRLADLLVNMLPQGLAPNIINNQ